MWGRDFLLLVQGQAVSCLGDTLYSVVAGLWVYGLTGSTVAMSAVYAAGNLARLLTFPLAGVITDRYSRRNLVVFCDAICGISMLAVAAVSEFAAEAAVWALVGYSGISSICYGVFHSSISTLMLSLVRKEDFVRANSVYSAVEYGVNVIGQGIAGTLYLFLGAPVIFLFNGLTFLISAGTEILIHKDAKPERDKTKPFFSEALEGACYIFRSSGVRLVLLTAFLINFTFGVLRVALVPWMLEFGEECYGLLGSFRSAGVILGAVLLAVKNIPEAKRYQVYYWSQLLFPACIATAAGLHDFLPIAVLFCVAYANQYVFNSLQRSAVILASPDEIRGKVICAVQALTMGFSAFGNLTGGYLCRWKSPKELIFFMMVLLFLCVVCLAGKTSVRKLFAVPQR